MPSCSKEPRPGPGRSRTGILSSSSRRMRCWRGASARRLRRRGACADQGMRVVGGRLGGRTLYAPRGRATRPTPEKVREALFSILGDVEGMDVLDLFAGSGALAIEALSRGAARATLVDSAAAAHDAIRRNLESLELTAEVRRQTAASFLARASEAMAQYDLVFLDPPYRQATVLGREARPALEPVLSTGRPCGDRERPPGPAGAANDGFARRTALRYSDPHPQWPPITAERSRKSNENTKREILYTKTKEQKH